MDYSTNHKMVAPKAEMPLYHQSREHGRSSFSRRKRASAGSKRRSGGNTMWWWLVIISPLVLVAFCLGTFLGIELARAPIKDTASAPGMYLEHFVSRRCLIRAGLRRHLDQLREKRTSVRPVPYFLPFGDFDFDHRYLGLFDLASWVLSERSYSQRAVQEQGALLVAPATALVLADRRRRFAYRDNRSLCLQAPPHAMILLLLSTLLGRCF